MTKRVTNAQLAEKIDWLDHRIDGLADMIAALNNRMMAQFEYLIREIHRVEDGRPRPAKGNGADAAGPVFDPSDPGV